MRICIQSGTRRMRHKALSLNSNSQESVCIFWCLAHAVCGTRTLISRRRHGSCRVSLCRTEYLCAAYRGADSDMARAAWLMPCHACISMCCITVSFVVCRKSRCVVNCQYSHIRCISISRCSMSVSIYLSSHCAVQVCTCIIKSLCIGGIAAWL